MPMLENTKSGLYCRAADAWIDPSSPVARALITHAHADHAKPGCGEYWAVDQSEGILRQRLGGDITLNPMPYGQPFWLNQACVSFHSAGHVLGSAQIRLQVENEVWVVTGDFKRCPDPSCEPFEVVPCNVLITEATFALPIYNWEPGRRIAEQIRNWWYGDRSRTSLLFCYAFGKAQRLLAELHAIGVSEEVLLHGAVETVTRHYRAAEVPMVPSRPVSELPRKDDLSGRLVLAPPSAHRSSWMRRFKAPQTAFASGWMAVRGARRRRGYERGFVLSDHADWKGLIQTVKDTGAQRVYVTHGQDDVFARYLREVQGVEAHPLSVLV